MTMAVGPACKLPHSMVTGRFIVRREQEVRQTGLFPACSPQACYASSPQKSAGTAVVFLHPQSSSSLSFCNLSAALLYRCYRGYRAQTH